MGWQRIVKRLLATGFRGAWLARRAQAGNVAVQEAGARNPAPAASRESGDQRRSILFITVDQQRFDALGAHGGLVARTPCLDALATSGVDYHRCHVQNVVCMPSRATMLTGQHPWTHGVVTNGVRLPDDAPSVAELLRTEAGYRTALLGKAHFDPHFDLTLKWFENHASAKGLDGPWHGFEHLEFATHGPMVGHHYAAWLWAEHPEFIDSFGGVLTAEGGGDTGAPEVAHNRIPRELYHTEWVADRTIAWLDSVQDHEPFFCWMSFPDPHHPLDPPYEEVKRRVDWRDVPLPERWPESREAGRAVLRDKPRHWLDWYEGRYRNPEGGPVLFDPRRFTAEQCREVNAMIAVENELIDEACARVLSWLDARGRLATTDIVFTSDHGELQGDFGLMFKGPYHVDSLLRVPLIWRPAEVAGVAPGVVPAPVGHVDLAPTFCRIAGVPVPSWMQGEPLPTAGDGGRERVITTFDSQFAPVGMHLQTLYRDGLLCTAYSPSTSDEGGRFPLLWRVWGAGSTVPRYDGSEGELYDLREDPHQRRNLWAEPGWRRRREELLDDLRGHLPPKRSPPLPVDAPT